VTARKGRGVGDLHLVKIQKGGETFPSGCLVLSRAAIYGTAQTILKGVTYFLLRDKVIQNYEAEENIKSPVLSKSRNNT
jgi:hypothetical protein